MTCKGICDRFASAPRKFRVKYKNGSNCTACDFYFQFKVIRCPCCGLLCRQPHFVKTRIK